MAANRCPAVTRRLAAAAAALFVLAASTDWGLFDERGVAICAKDRASCETALRAWRKGWLPAWHLDGASCRPLPNCFTSRENCIQGYNCEPR